MYIYIYIYIYIYYINLFNTFKVIILSKRENRTLLIYFDLAYLLKFTYINYLPNKCALHILII